MNSFKIVRVRVKLVFIHAVFLKQTWREASWIRFQNSDGKSSDEHTEWRGTFYPCMFISYPMDRHDEPGHWDGAFWHRGILITEASLSAHGNDGLPPQQPPLLHFRTQIPSHKGEVKDTGRHSLCPTHDSFHPMGFSSEHPLGLPR